MAKAGDEVYNPRQKDRMVFRQTARDTGGRLFQADMFALPGVPGPPEHIHLLQEERFETLRGVFRARVDGQERTLSVGESIVIPAGKSHTWWIEGDEEAHILIEIRPARNAETFFETMYGLVKDGKTDENGVPPVLQAALISGAYDMYLPGPPVILQKALFAALTPVAKLIGYSASYPEYSGEDTPRAGGSDGGGPHQVAIIAVAGAGILAAAWALRRKLGQRC